MNELEQKALAVRADKKALLKRLKFTVSVMNDEGARYMRDAKFDFKNARLVSVDGLVVLQWQTRKYPDAPESYNNQQTSSGYVRVLNTRASGKGE